MKLTNMEKELMQLIEYDIESKKLHIFIMKEIMDFWEKEFR